MSNPKAQEAIEAQYAQRLGKDALKRFKARFFMANPEQQKGMDKMLSQLSGVFKGEDKPLTEQEKGDLKGKALHPILYRGLVDHEPVGEELLQDLARQRAQAIADELVVVNKVAKERVELGKAEAVESDGKRVVVKLSLVVAPASAAAPAAIPPSGVTFPSAPTPLLAP
jgi:hypothetical protein